MIEVTDETLEHLADSGTFIMRYFKFEHLPEELQNISKVIADVAIRMVDTLDRSAELTAGLRKLLEAKDCFVRAAL